MAVRGLIFDYGGVLWDMRWDVSAAIAAEHGLPERALPDTMYRSETWRRLEVGIGDRDAWLRESHQALEALAGRALPALHQLWRAEQRWIESNLELITRLRPPYRTAILSNADRTLRERVTSRDGLFEMFDAFICSADIGVAKPDAKIYMFAAQQLGLAPDECVFIDDSEPNISAAQETGMRTVHFRIDQDHSLEAQLADLGVRAR
jgi:putative hydrolase of the HAD superfamily